MVRGGRGGGPGILCGSGLASFQAEPRGDDPDSVVIRDVALYGLSVPGRQTVPRAELNAILSVVRQAEPQTELSFKPDATYTASGVAAAGSDLRVRLAHGCNDDLWQELDSLCLQRDLRLLSSRTPAHVSIDSIVDGTVLRWWTFWAICWLTPLLEPLLVQCWVWLPCRCAPSRCGSNAPS